MITDTTVVKLLWEHDPEVLEELRELETGMENYPALDQDWVWVIEENGRIVASLFAAPAHGTVILLRLNSKAASPYAIRRLLGEALQSMKARGYPMFISFLDATQVKELKLARLIQHYGGQLIPFSGFIGCGRIK
jgi:hypothetical protein